MLPRSKRTESALAKAKFGVPVTRRALIARVNRKLAERDEQVCITRGERASRKSAPIGCGITAEKDIELEDFPRKLGVLEGR